MHTQAYRELIATVHTQLGHDPNWYAFVQQQ